MKKSLVIILNIFLISLFIGCSSSKEIADLEKIDNPLSTDGVILQGFSWDSCKQGNWWNVISNNSTEIKDSFEYVWFPPCSDSTSDNGYLPRELNNYSSKYGNESELKAAIEAIKPTKSIADIVINHRCGTTSWGDFTNPSFGTIKGVNYQSICADDEGFSSDSYMKGVSVSMRGSADTGEGYNSGRDLNHRSLVVQNGIIEWMKSLKEMGFVGWRYDYVKGFDGKFIGKYNKATTSEISFGEYWPSAGYNSRNSSLWKSEINQWINSTMQDDGQYASVFDFTLKGAFNTVFGTTKGCANSNYSLLADSSNFAVSNPEVAITFVDNHDTGSTQKLWPIDSDDIGTAYVYILTHPGIPCVAWQHYFTGVSDSVCSSTVLGTENSLKKHIKYLIDLRKTLGISNLSQLENLSATSSVYAAKITGLKGSVVVSIGSENYSCPDGYKVAYSGTNWIIYTESNE